MIIAIDGPAGAGKSTVARAVAARLGFDYLDTGAMYRAVALAVIEAGVRPDDHEAVADLARGLDVRVEGEGIFIGTRDVSERIRAPDVTSIVSQVSAQPGVRSALADRQRQVARARDVVVEGRDIGTVVFPEATLKVFLTASLDERARRRSLQDRLGTDERVLADIRESLERRDAADQSRSESPLARAPDAVLVDSTGKALDDVVAEVLELVRRDERA